MSSDQEKEIEEIMHFLTDVVKNYLDPKFTSKGFKGLITIELNCLDNKIASYSTTIKRSYNKNNNLIDNKNIDFS